VDCLGEHLVAQTDGDLSSAQRAQVFAVREALGLSGTHHQRSDRHVGTAGSAERSPQPLGNTAVPGEIIALENEISWALRLDAGYSHGLFADQRDNRWRILHNRIAPGVPIHPDGLRGARVLNTFAYTCGFSVCAATAGAHATSIDLSARWLEWGKHNFTINGIDPEGHLFLKGDVLSWLPKLGRQGRRYELVILDPPTFARMARKRVFRAERDYGALIQSAAPLVAPGGWILASTNAQRIPADDFQSLVAGGITAAGHTVEDMHFAPQPFDFPVHKEQPAHLKTVWVKVGDPRV
jgi:23S rRNA (cytosine1962-C5)-methyltransferase